MVNSRQPHRFRYSTSRIITSFNHLKRVFLLMSTVPTNLSCLVIGLVINNNRHIFLKNYSPMLNYTLNIGLFIGKRQSPICTSCFITLVLACSATHVGRITDTKHLYSDWLLVEWDRNVHHPQTIMRREMGESIFATKRTFCAAQLTSACFVQ